MEIIAAFLADPMNSAVLLKVINGLGEYFLAKKDPIFVLRDASNTIIYFESLRGAEKQLDTQESAKKG